MLKVFVSHSSTIVPKRFSISERQHTDHSRWKRVIFLVLGLLPGLRTSIVAVTARAGR